MSFSGEELRKFVLGSVLIFGAAGFWAMVIAGLCKYTFNLNESFALKYIGGSVFFLFSMWGVIRYSKGLKKHIR